MIAFAIKNIKHNYYVSDDRSAGSLLKVKLFVFESTAKKYLIEKFVKSHDFTIVKVEINEIPAKPNKNDVFVKHIEDHLKEMGLEKVICKICNEDIDTIYQEATKEIKKCRIEGCNKETASKFHSICYDHKMSI